jgi:hypothetical protein
VLLMLLVVECGKEEVVVFEPDSVVVILDWALVGVDENANTISVTLIKIIVAEFIFQG